MKTEIAARSISRPVQHQLFKGSYSGQVLAVFDEACNLVDAEGDVVALVTPRIGNGPLNIVVDGAAGAFSGTRPGAHVALQTDRLASAGLQVDLADATVWEPRPDWKTLRARRVAIASRLPLLRSLCLKHAPPASLVSLLGAHHAIDIPNQAVFSAAHRAASALRRGWAGEPERLYKGTLGLAGLGGGLTPAGDDFLAGLMLWTWLAHPTPEPICRVMVQTAAPRSTKLAAAFMRTSARGECSASWHKLLAALSEGHEAEIAATASEMLAHGATSGADNLAGFLFLAA
jgi:hypothetical protein